MKNLPIGIQSFEKLRNANDIYVDKTQDMWNLINNGSVYFLSRPRRFGKSLLVSALSELFAGKKQLFEGLHIYDKWDWTKTYPVIHLDFSEITYSTTDELKLSLNKFVEMTAENNKITIDKELPLSMKFAELIKKLREKAGNHVVVLVDEYDKPMIDNIGREEYPEVKRTLHDFYQVIKASDKHLKFVLLTGVSRFSGLSIFSGLNNLNDITMNRKYLTICGYTQEELEENFKEYVEEAGKSLNMSYNETLNTIKNWYNGYSWDGKTFVYNPFSTLLFFDNKKPEEYWYETGTPTFLMEEIKKKNDLYCFASTQEVESNTLKGNGSDEQEITTLLFQTGYLTVKKEEIKKDSTPQYTLDFPNMEVRKAFLSSLLVAYAKKETKEVKGIGEKVREAIEEKDEEGLKEVLTELYANVSYDLHVSKEKYYHSLFLVTARLSGYKTDSEVHTDKGRIDVVLKKDGSVIVVEIKYGDKKVRKLLDEAMRQIKEKMYYEKYASSDVSLLAVAFGKGKEIDCEFQEL